METFWTDLEKRFLDAHNGQRGDFVRACYGDFTPYITGGDADSRKQFERLATRAASRCGCPAGTDPVAFWLDLLKNGSHRYEAINSSVNRRRSELDTEQMCSREREIKDSQGGAIGLLFKASAEQCLERDTQEQLLKTAHDNSAIRPVIESSRGTGSLHGPKRSKIQSHGQNERHANRKANIPEQQAVPTIPAKVVTLVGKLIKEFKILKPQMHNESHYDKLRALHPGYRSFKMAKVHGDDVRGWIANIQERRRVEGLAQEVAARHFNILPDTVKKYWSHRGKTGKLKKISH